MRKNKKNLQNLIIVKSSKISAPQKVPKNFTCSFLIFDKENKQKYYLHIFGPSLLLLKRKFYFNNFSRNDKDFEMS